MDKRNDANITDERGYCGIRRIRSDMFDGTTYVEVTYSIAES